MKSFVIVCLFALLAFVQARPDKYTDTYDNVDLDEILQNDRLLDNYMQCMMDQGTCTPDGKELKGHIHEALETECANCTDAQKKGTEKVIAHLINNKPEYWKQLCAKYDPQNKYTDKYKQRLEVIKA